MDWHDGFRCAIHHSAVVYVGVDRIE
jgi:hypothetical protein